MTPYAKINKNILSQIVDMIEYSLTQTVHMTNQVSDTLIQAHVNLLIKVKSQINEAHFDCK